MKFVSVIIPTLNEAGSIQQCLLTLQSLREQGHEVILVDGGSHDSTCVLAAPLVDKLMTGKKGRAHQLNYGAQQAGGHLLLFLHADTLLNEAVRTELLEIASHESVWGRFDVQLSGDHYLYRGIEFCMNTRSRITGIATGDQAIFCNKKLFEEVGGFPEIELMEDITLSANLKKIKWPICSREKVITSSRRWDREGIVKTVLKMLLYRLRYALGAKPEKLAREYDG
ncbi:MAG: glycosyltransferase [Gammaproteobacteria bacterium]|nr:glycosyltransferase [Gammaproteobacteria bacterium]